MGETRYCTRHAADVRLVSGALRIPLRSQRRSDESGRGRHLTQGRPLRGRDPALSGAKVRHLLEAPKAQTLKAKRDQAIISILFYHALRRDELCKLMVKDIHERRGVKHLRVHGKGAKVRHVPLHPGSQEQIDEYLQAAGHGGIPSAPLFKPIRNNRRRLPADQDLREADRRLGGPLRPALRPGDRRDQRPGCRRRHRQGPGMARPRERQHDPNLRSPQDAAGGFADVQGQILGVPHRALDTTSVQAALNQATGKRLGNTSPSRLPGFAVPARRSRIIAAVSAGTSLPTSPCIAVPTTRCCSSLNARSASRCSTLSVPAS